MSTSIEKLIKAKELILEVEIDLIENNRACPYEIGYTLRKLEDSINYLQNLNKEEEKNN